MHLVEPSAIENHKIHTITQVIVLQTRQNL